MTYLPTVKELTEQKHLEALPISDEPPLQSEEVITNS